MYIFTLSAFDEIDFFWFNSKQKKLKILEIFIKCVPTLVFFNYDELFCLYLSIYKDNI